MRCAALYPTLLAVPGLPPNSWAGPGLIRIDAGVGLSGSTRQRLPEDRRKWCAVRRPLAGRSSALNPPPGTFVDQDVGDDGRPGWPHSATGRGVSVGQFFERRPPGGRGQEGLQLLLPVVERLRLG